jgi:hypothetical protein
MSGRDKRGRETQLRSRLDERGRFKAVLREKGLMAPPKLVLMEPL